MSTREAWANEWRYFKKRNWIAAVVGLAGLTAPAWAPNANVARAWQQMSFAAPDIMQIGRKREPYDKNLGKRGKIVPEPFRLKTVQAELMEVRQINGHLVPKAAADQFEQLLISEPTVQSHSRSGPFMLTRQGATDESEAMLLARPAATKQTKLNPALAFA